MKDKPKKPKDFEIRALGAVDSEGVLKYTPIDKATLISQLAYYAKGQKVRIIIVPYDPLKEAEDLRSKSQNRYYHLLLDIICDHTGDEHLDMHEQLKIQLLGRPYVLKDKEIILVKSTKELTTKEFGDYLEKVFKFASEQFGLVLPSSNQYY